MPRCRFAACATACLSLFFFFAATGAAMGATGGGSTNTTVYSNSTKFVEHDTVVDLPPTGGASAQTLLSTLLGAYPDAAPTGFPLDKALADPVVRQAVLQAQQQVLHAGGTLFASPTTNLGASPVFVGKVLASSSVTTVVTTYVGPQTILIGDNQGTSFFLVGGQIDIDILARTDAYYTLTYQLMGTNLIADVPGLAWIGTNGAGQYEVLDTASVYSLSASGLPVALYQRKALLNMIDTAIGDVNGHLFRLRSRAMGQTAGMSSGDAAITGRWEWFGTGNFGDQSQDGAGSTPAFGSHTYAGTVGAEYTYSPQLKFGFAGTGMKNYSDLDFLGHMDINGLVLSAYGAWTSGPWYVDGLYGIGLYDDEIRRNTLLGNTASANPEALTHSFKVNTGYNIGLGKGLVTGPTLGAAYTHGRLDSYTETGGGSANLSVAAQTFDSLITDLGWQASYEMPVPVGLLTFQGRTSWRRENLTDNDTVRIELMQSPFLLVDPHGGFTRTGSFAFDASPASAEANYWVLGAGVRLDIMAKSAAVLLNCEEHFGSQNREQFVSLSAQFRF